MTCPPPLARPSHRRSPTYVPGLSLQVPVCVSAFSGRRSALSSCMGQARGAASTREKQRWENPQCPLLSGMFLRASQRPPEGLSPNCPEAACSLRHPASLALRSLSHFAHLLIVPPGIPSLRKAPCAQVFVSGSAPGTPSLI